MTGELGLDLVETSEETSGEGRERGMEIAAKEREVYTSLEMSLWPSAVEGTDGGNGFTRES